MNTRTKREQENIPVSFFVPRELYKAARHNQVEEGTNMRAWLIAAMYEKLKRDGEK